MKNKRPCSPAKLPANQQLALYAGPTVREGRIWLSDSPSPFALLKLAPFGEAAKALLAFSTLRIAGGVYFMIHLIVVLNFRSRFTAADSSPGADLV